MADIDRIASWPEDWPIITMLPLREGRQDNAMLSQRRSVEVLRQALPNPLFYDSEWMMGSGLVGGYALSGSDHAEQAGELVLEILQGSKPVNLPFRVETKHQWIFDQRELNRFDWSHDVLPQSAVIQHSDIDFWQRHRQVIYPMLLALAIAALIIVLLGLTVRRQRRAETQLLLQKQRLSAALSASHAGVFEIRPHWRYASPRWLELMNLESHEESEDIDEEWMRNATSDSHKLYNEALRRLSGESDRERIELIIKGARPRILDVLLTNSRNKTNQPGAIVGVATDITATRQLEDEAARRNRLELLGELAGGIAHDFNNYLLVINSNADTAKKLDNPEEIRELITEIEKAGDRANDTVKQLLSFGKNDPKSEKVIDMNEAVRRSHSFLQRIVGKSSEIVVTLYSEPLGVRIDRPQMERVLSNLVLNARDAISNGSAINLEVRLKTIDFVEYVVVIVRDEGQGMSEAISDHVFEPFYTTKGVDEGTGLGLSTVYGIVKGSGGKVSVKSQPGVGTVFELVWPREEYVGSATPAAVVRQDKFDEKTILVVEDDPHVGLVTRRLLEDTGFSVFLAEDGKAGLKTFSERPKKWDLVLSDVVLPELNGIEMMSEIKRLNPSVKVGFISGFTDHSSLCGTRLPPNAPLLKKPYSRNELQLYVEGLLDETVSSNEVALT